MTGSGSTQRAGAAQPTHVQVASCESSEFGECDEYAKQIIVGPTPLPPNLPAIRAQVLTNLGLNADDYTVQLHTPNSCTGAILAGTLAPGSKYTFCIDKIPTIDAHVKPRKPASKFDSIKTQLDNDRRRGGNLPSIGSANTNNKMARDTKPLDYTKPSPLDTLKPPKRRASARSQGLEQHEFYRIGEGGREVNWEQGIPCETWLIAKVPKDDFENDRQVTFLTVTCWKIGGVQVGRCAEGAEWDFDEKPESYQLDPAFAFFDTAEAISKDLFDIVDGLYDQFDLVALVPEKGLSKSQIVAAPLSPGFANRDREPHILSPYNSKASIAVVVSFKNKINNQDLELDYDFQINIASTDTCTKLQNVLLEGDEGWKGLNNNIVLSGVQDGFTVELWVLPNGNDFSDMYCWNDLDDWKACEWLDREVVAWYGRRLYVEAHILPASNEDESTPDIDTREKSGLHEEAVEDSDEDNIVVATIWKPNDKKRGVRDDADEEDEEDDDEGQAPRPLSEPHVKVSKRGKKKTKRPRRD